MIYPLKKIRTTQRFGVNPQIYRRFGMRGHNGHDFRVRFAVGNGSGETYFNERAQIRGKIYTENTARGNIFLFATTSGKLSRAQNNKKGYGWYYRIITPKGAEHVLGHNSVLFYRVGEKVEKGWIIGITGNSGFSTGSHVHFGYRPPKYNRGNGFAGYEDQARLYTDLPTVASAGNNELAQKVKNKPTNQITSTNMKVSKDFQAVIKSLTGENVGSKMNDNEMGRVAERLGRVSARIVTLKDERDEAMRELAKIKIELKDIDDAVLFEKKDYAQKLQNKIDELSGELTVKNEEVADLKLRNVKLKSAFDICKTNAVKNAAKVKDLQIDITDLNIEIESLKQGGGSPFGLTADEAVEFITSKDWTRASWTLLNFAMAVGVSYISYLASDQNIAIAATVLPLAQAAAQFVTKKLNKK